MDGIPDNARKGRPAPSQTVSGEPASPSPKLIPLGEGLVCDAETGECSSPGITAPNRAKTER